MPEPMEEIKPSWGDMMEAIDGDPAAVDLPPPSEVIEKDIKKLIEYKINEEGKRIKVTKVYQLQNVKVSKSIAKRKAWSKFGLAVKDNPHVRRRRCLPRVHHEQRRSGRHGEGRSAEEVEGEQHREVSGVQGRPLDHQVSVQGVVATAERYRGQGEGQRQRGRGRWRTTDGRPQQTGWKQVHSTFP